MMFFATIGSLTGEPLLDFVMQTGVVGLAMWLMYRLMLKQMEMRTSKSGDSRAMFQAVEAFRNIQQSLAPMSDHMVSMLRLMERQMVLMENMGEHQTQSMEEIRSEIRDIKRKLSLLESSPHATPSLPVRKKP